MVYNMFVMDRVVERTANIGTFQYGKIFYGRDISRDLADPEQMARRNREILSNKNMILFDRHHLPVRRGVEVINMGYIRED